MAVISHGGSCDGMMDWTKGAQMAPKKVGKRGTQMDWTKGAQMVLKKVGTRGTQMVGMTGAQG